MCATCKPDLAAGLGSWSTALFPWSEALVQKHSQLVIHLGLPSSTVMSLCQGAVIPWDCSPCLCLGCSHERWEQRVARGEKAKLSSSHCGLGGNSLFFGVQSLCPWRWLGDQLGRNTVPCAWPELLSRHRGDGLKTHAEQRSLQTLPVTMCCLHPPPPHFRVHGDRGKGISGSGAFLLSIQRLNPGSFFNRSLSWKGICFL